MNLKDLCRLLLTTTLSNREVAAAGSVSHNTAGRYRSRLTEEGLGWTEVREMSETALEQRLNDSRQRHRKRFVEPDFAHVHAELRRAGVTLVLLYEEYAAGNDAGVMSEREFRRRYEAYERSLGIVMRQPRAPGYQLFLDYSGKRPHVTNPVTGEQTPVELFVAVMGASRKTFAYATATQRLPDWIGANIAAMEFYEGVPALLVPDNLKSAVVSVSRKDGHVINPSYAEMAAHYDSVVMPTRPRKPKDKAPVEIGVLLTQRWIIARLRHRIFYTLADLNAAIAELLERMNNRPMRGHGNKSRNQLFDELDRPALKPLPEQRYEFADWKLDVVVSQDYHVMWQEHYYSVPYRYVGAKVRVRATASTVEVFHKNAAFPIATHVRTDEAGQCSTLEEHQPDAHRAYAQGQMSDLTAWAEKAGPQVHAFVKNHIEKHRRTALSAQAIRGLRTLERVYGLSRLEAACARAVRMHATSTSSVRSMLERGIENTPLRGEDAANDPLPAHENVRGAASYE